MKLPTNEQMRAAAQNKLNRRPLSRDKRGFLKASGKMSAHQVAQIRKVNVLIANRKEA